MVVVSFADLPDKSRKKRSPSYIRDQDGYKSTNSFSAHFEHHRKEVHLRSSVQESQVEMLKVYRVYISSQTTISNTDRRERLSPSSPNTQFQKERLAAFMEVHQERATFLKPPPLCRQHTHTCPRGWETTHNPFAVNLDERPSAAPKLRSKPPLPLNPPANMGRMHAFKTTEMLEVPFRIRSLKAVVSRLISKI